MEVEVSFDHSGIRARDPQSLGRFFDTYAAQVYDVAHRLCGERAASEDLTQEVFYRVHRAANRLLDGKDPWPWLLTILYNLFRDQARKRERHPVVSTEEAPRQVAAARAHESAPILELVATEQTELVQQAVSELPEDQRVAVILRDYEGMAHADIARVLGVTPVAARKCYSRALARLGQMLGEKLR